MTSCVHNVRLTSLCCYLADDVMCSLCHVAESLHGRSRGEHSEIELCVSFINESQQPMMSLRVRLRPRLLFTHVSETEEVLWARPRPRILGYKSQQPDLQLGSPQTTSLRDESQQPRRTLTARLSLSIVQSVQKLKALLRPLFQAPGSEFFLLTTQCFVKVLGKLPLANNPGQLRRYRAVLGPTVMSLQVSAFLKTSSAQLHLFIHFGIIICGALLWGALLYCLWRDAWDR